LLVQTRTQLKNLKNFLHLYTDTNSHAALTRIQTCASVYWY